VRVRLKRRRLRGRKWPKQYPYNPAYWSTPELGDAWSAFLARMYFPGSASTQGGRSHLPQLSREAKQRRRELAWRAYHLRVVEGREIRDIAEELGVSKSTVGRWLQGVPRVKQDQLRLREIN
jgi:hypothetical protein